MYASGETYEGQFVSRASENYGVNRQSAASPIVLVAGQWHEDKPNGHGVTYWRDDHYSLGSIGMDR